MEDVFSATDLRALTALVSERWLAGAHRDWTAPAGTLDWTCTQTADHAVDTVMAPAFFLASRKLDGYPDFGWGPFTMGDDATPAQLVEGLQAATRLLCGVVADAEPDARAAIWRWPEAEARPPADFLPRGGLELILHGHDVCAGLDVVFEPQADLCQRLREHTRDWPMWVVWGHGLGASDDPWADLLRGSGRSRAGG